MTTQDRQPSDGPPTPPGADDTKRQADGTSRGEVGRTPAVSPAAHCPSCRAVREAAERVRIALDFVYSVPDDERSMEEDRAVYDELAAARSALEQALAQICTAQAGRAPSEAARPKVVCLCGSLRFVAEMAYLSWVLERDGGYIVLALHLLPDNYPGLQPDHQAEAEGVAAKMDDLHLRKIGLADEVLVVSIGGYIGESTRREIAYATAHGKPVRYLESVAPPGPSEAPAAGEESK